MSKIIKAYELYELCKKVYELTGWNDLANDHPWITERGVIGYERNGVAPLYTSDYLLEKLPNTIDVADRVEYLTIYHGGQDRRWFANYEVDEPMCFEVFADTPLKALLKLTIALSEAGELDNE